MAATIDNRDSDIPVVLLGFRFRRSHRQKQGVRQRYIGVETGWENGEVIDAQSCVYEMQQSRVRL
jgi:hypothetical protein